MVAINKGRFSAGAGADNALETVYGNMPTFGLAAVTEPPVEPYRTPSEYHPR